RGLIRILLIRPKLQSTCSPAVPMGESRLATRCANNGVHNGKPSDNRKGGRPVPQWKCQLAKDLGRNSVSRHCWALLGKRCDCQARGVCTCLPSNPAPPPTSSRDHNLRFDPLTLPDCWLKGCRYPKTPDLRRRSRSLASALGYIVPWWPMSDNESRTTGPSFSGRTNPMRSFPLTPLLAMLVFSEVHAQLPDGNRLTYLDETNPYYVSRRFPKLVTPQWVGEPGVEAVVVLAIDDMRDPKKYEAFLRPVLRRLQQIDGRAPVSIMTCQVDPKDPQLQTWLKEGLS